MKAVLDRMSVEKNRQEIISLLKSTNRKGIDNVLRYLDGVGFYTAPSSVDRHHNWLGGLAQHSLGTCRRALEVCRGVDRESVIIAALLHDICKASKLYYGADGCIHRRSTSIKGHGYRSVALLRREGLELTRDEWVAIRWHMGLENATPLEAAEANATRLRSVVMRGDKYDAARGRKVN